MGNSTGQVYYDQQKGQFYNMIPGTTFSGLPGQFSMLRNYLGNPSSQNQPSQTISNLIARANAAAQNVQTPTLASLFPGMSFGQSPMMNNQFSGQFGAGRFLGQGASQFGNPSMPMGGFAPTANTTT